MSQKATEYQKEEMRGMNRGKEVFKPLNTGWVDERVACVRGWVANIFFYRKGGTTIMVDAGEIQPMAADVKNRRQINLENAKRGK